MSLRCSSREMLCCLRLPTYGGLFAWEFEKDGRELNVRVEGQLVFNRLQQIVTAA
jgi:hypothetical protein